MDMLTAYQNRVTDGSLQADPDQVRILQALVTLGENLLRISPRGLLTRAFFRKPEPPRGLYVFGAVGRGKTMLMDLFFGCVEVLPKRRIHFHAFMQEVHGLRAKQKTIEQIADTFSQKAKLLCLDEMQIVDIADAMLVGRLYEALHLRDVVLVTTANLAPDDLYKDGLNRDLFLPFIAKLKATMDVVSLDSPRDYRLGRMKGRETFLHPNREWTQAEIGEMWMDMTDHAEDQSLDLDVLGRKLHVPFAAHGCASFDFDDLCREALGPADFLAIAKNFSTVFISLIPALKDHERNELKRFVLMIDTFYDAGTRLVALSDVPPEEICPKKLYGVEFARTLSRLQEMRSASWWEKGLEATPQQG